MIWDGLTPPYATLVADPPWPYRTATTGRRPLPLRDPSWRGVEQMGYSIMEMADLFALPVADLAAPNAHLYLWTTNAFMVEAHQLARAWRFNPKTILTWVKTHQGDQERLSRKTGYWFRSSTEHVVFAVRGSLPLRVREAVPTAFLWPRIGAHSVKPPAFLDMVEQVSPGPYVALFARQPRLGWDSWGHGFEHLGEAPHAG